MMMNGIISGSAESFAASANWPKVARFRLTPLGPKKWLKIISPKPTRRPGTTPPRNSPPIETLPVAP